MRLRFIIIKNMVGRNVVNVYVCWCVVIMINSIMSGMIMVIVENVVKLLIWSILLMMKCGRVRMFGGYLYD